MNWQMRLIASSKKSIDDAITSGNYKRARKILVRVLDDCVTNKFDFSEEARNVILNEMFPNYRALLEPELQSPDLKRET